MSARPREIARQTEEIVTPGTDRVPVFRDDRGALMCGPGARVPR